jgi:predicted  nucleic acid-binding Zn-ribbon protein
MSLQAILKYQEVDGKLFKLERELAGSEERKEYVKVKKFIESAPEKLDALEAKATSLNAEAETLVKKSAQLEAALADFEHVSELVGGGADVAFYQKKVQSVVEQIKKLKAELNTLTASIKAADAEYQKMKKQVIAVQKQAPEVQKKYQALKSSQEDERKEIEKELSALAKDIDPAFLAKYAVKRKEKLFPIVGQAMSGRCPFCGMEPPLAQRSKLADGIECDNCHKIIFE